MNQYLILLVEDDQDISFNISLLLELNNYAVLTASNGKKAIEILNFCEILPDLILSDILMPEMNGYELFERITKDQNWNTIPFIFITAKATANEIKYGKILGVDGYITKPVDEDLLLSMISKKIRQIHQLEINLINKGDINNKNEIQTSLDKNITLSGKIPIGLFVVGCTIGREPKLLKKRINQDLKIDLDPLICQLFKSTRLLLKNQELISPELIIANIPSINLKTLVLFDMIFLVNENTEQIMIGILDHSISYIDSTKIEKIFRLISEEVKNNNTDTIESYFNQINTLLNQNWLPSFT